METERVGRPGPLHYATLGVLLVAAACLRIVNADTEPLWGDEGLTLVLVNWPLRDLLFNPVDPTPALYYALHKLLAIAPDAGPGLVRSISIACGIGSVGMMYVLGRLALGAKAGLLAAALLALWSPHVDFSQEARAYILLFLLVLSSAASLLWWDRVVAQPGRARRVLALLSFVLTTALSFYAHLTAIFWILVAFPLFLTAGLRHRPRPIAEMLAATAGLTLLAIPGLIRLARQFEAGTNFNWLRQASAPEFVEKTATVLLPFDRWWLQAGAVALVVALSLWSRRASREGKSDANAVVQLLILGFLFLPILVWAAGFSIRPIFMERTVLFAIPGAILLVVALVESVPNRRAAALIAFLVATLLGHTLISQGTIRPREDWDGVQAYLERHVRPSDLILLCGYQYPSMRHAAVRPLPAPLIYLTGGTPVMLEERLGTRPDWDRLAFRYDIVPVTRQIPRRTVMEGRTITMAAGTVWMVEVDCLAGSRKDLSAPLGNPAWQRVWSSPETRPPRPRIDIVRTEVRSPATFRALAPRELRTGSPAR